MPKSIRTAFGFIVLVLLGTALHGADLTVKVIQNESDLPEKFSAIWKPGDLVASDGQYLLLIGGSRRPQITPVGYPAPDAMGSILGFLPAGKRLQAAVNIGAPQLRIKTKTEYITYKSVTFGSKPAADGTVTFECAAVFEKADWGKVEITTTYQVFPGQGRIVIASVLKNTGTVECKDLSYSLYFNANHTYSFSPYNRTAYPQLNFRVYPRKAHYLGWLNPNPVEEGERRNPGRLAPGAAFKVQYTLIADTQPDSLLQSLYQTQKTKTQRAAFAFKNIEGRFMEVIVRDPLTSSVFFRTFLEEPFSFDIPLPAGIYEVQANFFPAVRDKILAVNANSDNICVIEGPALGTVKVKIRNGKGEFVPGKVSFIGLDPNKTPYFRPENPRDTGRNHEAFKNSVFPPEEGVDVRLPVGIYLVSASRGLEYTRDEKVMEILKDDVHALTLTVDKVIDMPAWISLDPHMHTQNSDGQMLVPERLRSIVGEGVDVAVAADHNFVTDYAATLKRLGLNKYLAVVLGSEVTKGSVIHFNTYPMKLIEGEEMKGAISVVPDEASELFAASRAKNPQAIFQVNHPRAGDIGYFNNYQLDKETAAFANRGFDPAFQVMEAMNGPTFGRGNQEAVEDWLHLLNRGYYFPIMGASDSHGIDRGEPGFSRTYVFYSGGKGDALDADALFQAVRKGRSFVTNGPLIDFKVNAAAVPGDTLTAKDGKVDLSIKISSAPWISVDEVRLIVNGERRIVFPVKAADEALAKFRLSSLGITLDRDAALVVEVMGKRTLYPVVQRQTGEGLPANAALPHALTNPIFIDVDGNGKFDPIWPEKVRIKTEAKEDAK